MTQSSGGMFIWGHVYRRDLFYGGPSRNACRAKLWQYLVEGTIWISSSRQVIRIIDCQVEQKLDDDPKVLRLIVTMQDIENNLELALNEIGVVPNLLDVTIVNEEK